MKPTHIALFITAIAQLVAAFAAVVGVVRGVP